MILYCVAAAELGSQSHPTHPLLHRAPSPGQFRCASPSYQTYKHNCWGRKSSCTTSLLVSDSPTRCTASLPCAVTAHSAVPTLRRIKDAPPPPAPLPRLEVVPRSPSPRNGRCEINDLLARGMRSAHHPTPTTDLSSQAHRPTPDTDHRFTVPGTGPRSSPQHLGTSLQLNFFVI